MRQSQQVHSGGLFKYQNLSQWWGLHMEGGVSAWARWEVCLRKCSPVGGSNISAGKDSSHTGEGQQKWWETQQISKYVKDNRVRFLTV